MFFWNSGFSFADEIKSRHFPIHVVAVASCIPYDESTRPPAINGQHYDLTAIPLLDFTKD
jgi:hypothetical protein